MWRHGAMAERGFVVIPRKARNLNEYQSEKCTQIPRFARNDSDELRFLALLGMTVVHSDSSLRSE
jgi:hypothetical protein